MSDMDDEPGTITISTDKFSSYAIAWQETGSAGGSCLRGMDDHAAQEKENGRRGVKQ